MEIRVDDLKGPEIAALLETHLKLAAAASPADSVHVLDLNGLRVPQVTFWTAWEDANLLGCGALKELGNSECEIKSMHTAQAHRGKGVASAIVKVILKTARARGLARINLETGSSTEFAPARKLYASFGFQECGPFADYPVHDFSTFMTLALNP
jgi:putative acetyltransferase